MQPTHQKMVTPSCRLGNGGMRSVAYENRRPDKFRHQFRNRFPE